MTYRSQRPPGDGRELLEAALHRIGTDAYKGKFAQEDRGALLDSGGDWRARRFGHLLERYAHDPPEAHPEDLGYHRHP